MVYDVVVVGAGLGGLECAILLARQGLSVCVLEQGLQCGGALQPFLRRGVSLESGFHYVGAMDPDRPLRRLFSCLGIDSLPWLRMDDDCFDEVCVGGRSFAFAQGREQWVRSLVRSFPAEAEGIRRFSNALSSVGDHTLGPLSNPDPQAFYSNPAFSTSARSFINGVTSDPLLRKVLCGTALKMELSDNLPFYVFAQISSSFIDGAYRLLGGGRTLVDGLLSVLRRLDGVVRTKSRVEQLVWDDGRIRFARLASGEVVEGRYFVSDAHPSVTVSLIDPKAPLRPSYRKRYSRLPNTFGMFTANIVLKDGALPYLNKNIFVYTGDADPWAPASASDPASAVDGVMVSLGAVPRSQKSARTLDLLAPMSTIGLEQDFMLPVGRRSAAYYDRKQQMLDQCLALAQTRIPGLESMVESVYTSSPLTYCSYTSTPSGSAYGLRKDCNSTLLTFVPPITPVPNLFLTGQCLNLHGIMGVSVTAFITCAAIVGYDAVTRDLDLV